MNTPPITGFLRGCRRVREGASTPGDFGRHRRLVVAVSVISAVSSTMLLPLTGAVAARLQPTETVHALPVTAALKAEVRASFYRAYREDPRAFSLPPGLPLSSVIEPTLTEAALVEGATAADRSTWVIGPVCMRTPVACQDAGAFEVFYRTALTQGFVYWPGGLCDLPSPLAAAWFPGAHYPLGIVCPAGNTLVRRGGIRAGAWTAFVPRSWIHVAYGAVHSGQCSTAAVPKLASELCSSDGGDTDIDVWFDPTRRSERMTVTTCRGEDCFPSNPMHAPRFALPKRSTSTSRIGAWELAYYDAHGTPPLAPTSTGVTTLLLATHSGGRARYPVYTVTVELPPYQAALAAVIVDSFANP